jgi:hypothetical protein
MVSKTLLKFTWICFGILADNIAQKPYTNDSIKKTFLFHLYMFWHFSGQRRRNFAAVSDTPEADDGPDLARVLLFVNQN